MEEYIDFLKSNCKNCYKCIRHCPVKSIRFSGNQAHIVSDECILCGQCVLICPQQAKRIRSDIEKAKSILATNKFVAASIAPSFIAYFPDVSIASMEKVLRKLGFSQIEETAVGATLVKNEYERMIEEKSRNVIISSCCHTVNLLIEKYYPETLPYLANVVSPMHAHCLKLKMENPEIKTIYIGPCLSKKAEAEQTGGMVDCVLTFEELSQWIASEHIEFDRIPENNRQSKARLFPTTGGILKTMNCISDTYSYLAIDGVENCILALKDIMTGNLSNCFIEMSACPGSCIGGPAMNKTQHLPIRDFLAVEKIAGDQDFPVSELDPGAMRKDHFRIDISQRIPGDDEITAILRKLGKETPDDELNCGTCGYNTCREKAIAVCQGKADLTMCLPFLKEKSESISNQIIMNTPNGILILNEMLEVQQINDAARAIMNIHNASDVLGEPLVRILDPQDFQKVIDTGMRIVTKRTYLAEYLKFVERTIYYDKTSHLLMCIMKDITEEERAKDEKERISRESIEITVRVVEKQMRVVQEIASLLGETTVEMKVALSKLKDTLKNE